MAFIPNIKNVTEMVVNVKGEKLISKIKTGNDDKKENDVFIVDDVDVKAKDKQMVMVCSELSTNPV